MRRMIGMVGLTTVLAIVIRANTLGSATLTAKYGRK